jgi:hypothetical protein
VARVTGQEALVDLCAILASDRACGDAAVLQLPRPGSPECDAIFLGAWAAFRHVTTQIGRQVMRSADPTCRVDAMEAFVRGRDAVPAYLRWAETASMIEAGEWDGGPPPVRTSKVAHWAKRRLL